MGASLGLGGGVGRMGASLGLGGVGRMGGGAYAYPAACQSQQIGASATRGDASTVAVDFKLTPGIVKFTPVRAFWNLNIKVAE